MSNYSVILAAAGKSSRFNDPAHKKTYIELNQKPVWLHSAERFYNRDDVKQLIVVIAEDDREMFTRLFASQVSAMSIKVVIGGAERSDSVQNALCEVDKQCDFVAIHDAARPCVSDEEIERVFTAVEDSGAAILATRVTSTVKKSLDGESVSETIDRSTLWLGQTPQCFARQLIQDAYADRGDFVPTDEAQLVERTGKKVVLVEGSPQNIKLTTKADLLFAESVSSARIQSQQDAPTTKESSIWR